MKQLAAALLASALIIVPARTHAQTKAAETKAAQPKPPTLRAEIEIQLRGMENALKKGDLIGAARFYADDAQVRMSRTVVATGRKAIDDYFTSIKSPRDWKLEVFDVGGPTDQPWLAGRSTLVYGAKPITSVTDFLVIWKRQRDGKLRIILDYYTPSPRR